MSKPNVLKQGSIMNIFKTAIIVASFLTSQVIFAYGLGVSTHPLSLKKKVITTEFSGVIANGKGVGVQARYLQKIAPKISADAGLGVSSGERTGKIFAGADFEFFPDYAKQPRISLRTGLERSQEFGTAGNILSVTPTVSKGFSFWGKEAYPFLALPLAINLNADNNTYQSQATVAVGATGRIPIEGYKHLTASLEADVNLSDSYSAIYAGISYPLN